MIKAHSAAAYSFLVFYLLFINNVSADDNDRYGNIIEKSFPATYITFFGGFDREDNLKFDDIQYEAEINSHFNWYNKKHQHHKSDLVRLYIPIRLQVRQYTSSSSPVKTPSYNPGIKIFYADKNWLKSESNFHYASLGYHHYSNGQSGLHIDPVTKIINTDTGSFSSDYFELSYYRVNKKYLFEWAKINYRHYLTNLTWEKDQTDFYQDKFFDVSGRISLMSEKDKANSLFKAASLKLSMAYKMGRKFIVLGDKASDGDNMQYKAELNFQPVNWHDISLYARWDKGYDYYNINYASKMNRVHIGLVSVW